MTTILMIRGKEDGDYGYDEEPMTKSRGFCCNFIWPAANTEYKRRNSTITGPSTDARPQIMHTKNATTSDAVTSPNNCLVECWAL